MLRKDLKTELGTTPMTAFVIVPDLGVRFQTEPMRDLAILPRFASELLLNQERLVGRLCDRIQESIANHMKAILKTEEKFMR